MDLGLAARLRNRLDLERAVETGTWHGDTARRLADVFPTVVTIELSEDLWRRASRELSDIPNLDLLCGHSVRHLPHLAAKNVPTLYFLDGHWSSGDTAGAEDECPVLAEIRAIGAGHPDDCLIIDDARLFLASPPPPHDPEKWPTIVEVLDAIREQRPSHAITVLADQVIATPARAKPIVDEFGRAVAPGPSFLQRLFSRIHHVWLVSTRAFR